MKRSRRTDRGHALFMQFGWLPLSRIRRDRRSNFPDGGRHPLDGAIRRRFELSRIRWSVESGCRTDVRKPPPVDGSSRAGVSAELAYQQQGTAEHFQDSERFGSDASRSIDVRMGCLGALVNKPNLGHVLRDGRPLFWWHFFPPIDNSTKKLENLA